jgi:prepilin-type N-terminal cleavage/methylation domain-containing protein/prepilin-type processing-associated H-X9-DG protein
MNQRSASTTAPSGRRGFTLVELLVVIAIIGLLIALLLPAVQSARESGRLNACRNNLKQLAGAVLQHEAAKRGLPPAAVIWRTGTGGVPSITSGWSWMYYVLPYMEEEKLFQDGAVQPSEQLETAGGSPQRGYRLRTSSRPWMRCPSDGAVRTNVAETSYNACGGPRRARQSQFTAQGCPWPSPYDAYAPNSLTTAGEAGFYNQNARNPVTGMFIGIGMQNGSGLPAVNDMAAVIASCTLRAKDISDGMARTIMLGEIEARNNARQGGAGAAGAPNAFSGVTMTPTPTTLPINLLNPPPCRDNWTYTVGFKSRHAQGSNFAFGDGAVKFVGETVNMDLFQLMGHPRDGRAMTQAE